MLLASPNRSREPRNGSPTLKGCPRPSLMDPSPGGSPSNSTHSSRSTSPMNGVFRSLKRARFLRDKFSKRSFSDSSVSVDGSGRIRKGSRNTSPSQLLAPKYEFGAEQRSTSLIVHPRGRESGLVTSPKSGGTTSPKALGRRLQSTFSPWPEGIKRLTPEDLWASIGLHVCSGSGQPTIYSVLNIDVCGCTEGEDRLLPVNTWPNEMEHAEIHQVIHHPTLAETQTEFSALASTSNCVSKRKKLPPHLESMVKYCPAGKHRLWHSHHLNAETSLKTCETSTNAYSNNWGSRGNSWVGISPSYHDAKGPQPLHNQGCYGVSPFDHSVANNSLDTWTSGSKASVEALSKPTSTLSAPPPMDYFDLALDEAPRSSCAPHLREDLPLPSNHRTRRQNNDRVHPPNFNDPSPILSSPMTNEKAPSRRREARRHYRVPTTDGNNYDLQTLGPCPPAATTTASAGARPLLSSSTSTMTYSQSGYFMGSGPQPLPGAMSVSSARSRHNHPPHDTSSTRLDDEAGESGTRALRELKEQLPHPPLNCTEGSYFTESRFHRERTRNKSLRGKKPEGNERDELEAGEECGTEVGTDDSSGGRPRPEKTNIPPNEEQPKNVQIAERGCASSDVLQRVVGTVSSIQASESPQLEQTPHRVLSGTHQLPLTDGSKQHSVGNGPPKASPTPQTSLRIISAVPGEMEREELMDRLEQSLGYSTCRLPRVLTVAQRRRAGMVKQWSMDETKSWFYSRSSSLDRHYLPTQDEDTVNSGTSSPSTSVGSGPVPLGKVPSATSITGEKRRRFFQRKNTSSAPASSTESVDSSLPSRKSSQESSSAVSVVSKALEEVFRTSTLLNWDSSDLDMIPSAGVPLPGTIHSHLSATTTMPSPSLIADQDDPSASTSNPNAAAIIRDIGQMSLVRSRDGSHLSPNTQPYISLPSPNIQSAKPTVPGGMSPGMEEDEDSGPHPEHSTPDCSQLVRRGALVPPKMDPDDEPGGSTSNDEDYGGVQLQSSCSSSLLGGSLSGHGGISSSNVQDRSSVGSGFGSSSSKLSVPRAQLTDGDYTHKSGGGTGGRTFPPRRSSVVVIPPMQVCPGDLLVYSKALTHRGNYLELNGSTTSLANEADHNHSVTSSTSRKSKNTWSLLKLFDRDKKPKSESPGGLEEVLANLTQSEYSDEQLPRLCGLQWFDFVELVDMERKGRVPWLSNHHSHHQRDLDSPPTDLPPPDQPCSDVQSESPDDRVADLVNVSLTGLNNSATPRSKLAPAHRQRVSRLKRTQSERTSDMASSVGALRKFGPNGTSALAALNPDSSRGSSPETPTRSTPDSTSADQVGTNRNSIAGVRRSNLIHSMSFTAKELEATSRFVTSRESLTREQKRIESVWDLFQSEVAFLLDHLNVLKHVYMEPLKKVQVEGHIMFAEPEVLFGNLDELCCVTYSFCKEFLHLLLNLVEPDGDLPVPNLMLRLFDKGGKARTLSQAYHRYALNYINALNYLESLRRQPEFCEFEKWCNRDPRCKKLQLTDLLVAPVHHIMKIPLVIKDIEAKTDTVEEKAIIIKVLEMKEASLRELDDKMKWLKNFDRLLEIQRNIVWPSVLELDPKQYFPEFLKAALSRQPCERLIVSPRRQILMEGPLFLLDSGKPADMYLILFDDLLIITRRKKALSKKKSTLTENWGSVRGGINDSSMKYIVHKQPLSLDRFFIHEVAAQEALGAKLDHAFILICLNRFQQIVQVHTFQAETEVLKNAWLTKLREAQEIWKRTLQTTIFKGSTIGCGSGVPAGGGNTSPEAAKGAPALFS